MYNLPDFMDDIYISNVFHIRGSEDIKPYIVSKTMDSLRALPLANPFMS